MQLYFAYGSNMDRAAMRRRCREARALGPALLRDYAFFVGRDGWGSVKPRRGGSVHGVLWCVSPRDLAALHAYEWLHKGLYAMSKVPVRYGARHVRATIYVLRRRVEGRARPGYMETIAAAARDWRLPERYTRSLERMAA
ncbi:MAG: gamma-glutamylcyclotransferase [Pseudolabrys sp.]